MEKIIFVCEKKEMLVDFVLRKKPNLNFSMIKTALRKKDVRINEKKVCENQLLNAGDKIILFLPDKKRKNNEVIYEDENILIVNKLAGIETTKKDKAYFESESLEDIFEGCFACHRLDKNTEGLVVLAKNENAKRQMEKVFKNEKITKTYQTIVTGNVKNEGEKFVDHLEKLDDRVKIYKTPTENSKIVKTNYSVNCQKNDLFLLDVELLTGRTHQIRAHLSFHGIHVLGDQKYGDKEKNKKYNQKRQLLCATKICFGEIGGLLKNLSNKSFETKPSFSIENII